MFTLALPPVLSSLGIRLLDGATVKRRFQNSWRQATTFPHAHLRVLYNEWLSGVHTAHSSSTEWGNSVLSQDLEHFQECCFVSLEKLQVQHTSAEMQATSCRILILIRGSHVYADS